VNVIDLLLDALSYVGFGSWQQYLNMASAISDDALFAWQSAQLLAALGHIDIERDSATLRPKAWQISPPTLVELATGAWALTGARSARLLDELRSAVTRLGGRIEEGVVTEGVTFVHAHLEGSPAAQIVAALSEVPTPTADRLVASPYFLRDLAASLPPLSRILTAAPVLRVGSGHVERYVPGTGRWENHEHDAPGAYRLEHHGRTYGVTSPSDVDAHLMRVTDVFSAKHLAAAQAGLSLVGYDVSRNALVVPLGSDLPGLLARLAVLCSGVPARLRQDGALLEYASVPPQIASSIHHSLTH
jgi:hypothetical protein